MQGTNEPIHAGDKVRLKTGGSVMTVRVRSMNLVYCWWFEDGVLKEGTFDVRSLEHVPDDIEPNPTTG